VLGGDEEGLLGSGGDQSASGQVIGFAKETVGSLLDGGDRRLLQGVAFQTGKGQMVEQLAVRNQSDTAGILSLLSTPPSPGIYAADRLEDRGPTPDPITHHLSSQRILQYLEQP
jgi:hypothetical protein